jgi:Na+/H+-dicarboxylate symporter
MGRRLTLYILIGMVLGIAVGWLLHATIPADDPRLVQWADYFRLLPDVFLKLI